MTRARDASRIFTTASNNSDLNSIINISSASPTTGNINGKLWVDITTASAPVLQTYGAGEFRKTIVNRTKALGGDITQFGGYTIHTFLASSTFTALEPLNVEYLVVAGGGGGQTAYGGNGGGAGGYRTGTNFSATAQAYSITVGSGGASSTAGNDSIFSTITSAGGASGTNATGGSGSGGGAGNTPSTNPAQGTSGGTRISVDGVYAYGGGGGGASVAGSNATSGGPGAGGNGTDSSITGTSITRAGGGGGGAFLVGGTKSGGAGGTGGGGQGGTGANSRVNPVAGTINTGGGGGGVDDGGFNGAAGGSGIVIVRYLT
jgi:hypothetical protein